MDLNNNKYNIYKNLLGERECPLCHRWFKKLGFGNHYKRCKERNGDWTEPEKPKKIYICKFCGSEWDSREARNGHQMKCKLNPAREECIQKISESCKGRIIDEETKEKISTSMKDYHEKKKELGEGVVGKTNIKTNDGDDSLELFFKDEL